LLLAVKEARGATYWVNPPENLVLRRGVVLIVMGDVVQIRKARSEATHQSERAMITGHQKLFAADQRWRARVRALFEIRVNPRRRFAFPHSEIWASGNSNCGKGLGLLLLGRGVKNLRRRAVGKR